MYDFNRLREYLASRGMAIVPSSRELVAYVRDFSADERAGAAILNESGVYFQTDNGRVRGYLYIKKPNISQYGHYPKAHYLLCSTIEEKQRNNDFDDKYYWTSGRRVELIDRITSEHHTDVVLQLCQNCIAKDGTVGVNTEQFMEIAERQMGGIRMVRKTIDGYTLDWKEISETFRASVGYVCDECGAKPKSRYHKYYFHVHHKDGDKLNNAAENLRCLCVVCHSLVDDHHLSRMLNGAMRVHVRNYLNEYDAGERVQNAYQRARSLLQMRNQ